MPARRHAWRGMLGLCVGLLVPWSGSCTGPSLTVAADGPHFVDGRQVERTTLPFRYYGTVLIDVLPADDDEGRVDWLRAQNRVAVDIPPPATGWLFPFDLPLEILQHLWSGAADRTVAVTPQPATEIVVEGFQPDLQPLRNRAFAARIER